MTAALATAVADRVVLPVEGALRVIDEDGLIRSVSVLDELAGRGIAVVVWSDPVASRLAWSGTDPAAKRIVIIDRPERSEQLPADALREAPSQLRLGVGDLFGGLAPAVVRDLEWGDREGAFAVKPGANLDADATASLLLRSLHQLDPETMTRAETLLAGLLRLHQVTRATPISPSLLRVFANRVGDPLHGIDTADAVGDRARFLAWLSALWSAASSDPAAVEARALLLAEGPAQLLDDYLEDGLLEPVPPEVAVPGLPFGVGGSSAASRAARVSRELASITSRLDEGGVDYQAWREIAERWADALAVHYQDADALTADMQSARAALNAAFRAWLDGHFSKLSSLPWLPSPAMVHQTPDAMQARLGGAPQAVVVVDGLSLAAWRTLLAAIRRDAWHLTEATTFAWIPTITSVSRQAIFAGRPPIAFARSIGTTAREPELWRAWWAESQKLAPHDVGYIKVHLRNDIGEGVPLPSTAEAEIGRRVLGVVVEDVDHELHGERLGEGAFHAALRQWGNAGHLARLIDRLLDEGYEVVVTSDHGFAEVVTIGESQAGVLADRHGRFEVFDDELLLTQSLAKGKPAGRTRWSGHGLPGDYKVVLAPQDAALKPAGDRILTHGGTTIEEVIVPWVRITR